jgi:hypothetical protein
LESGDRSGTNYWISPESKTYHFPKVCPRVAQHSEVQFDNCIYFSQFFRSVAKRTSEHKHGLRNRGPTGQCLDPSNHPNSLPPSFLHHAMNKTKYLLDRICISFSEMHLSLGLNKLSGKNGKRINFTGYRVSHISAATLKWSYYMLCHCSSLYATVCDQQCRDSCTINGCTDN